MLLHLHYTKQDLFATGFETLGTDPVRHQISRKKVFRKKKGCGARVGLMLEKSNALHRVPYLDRAFSECAQ